MTKKRKKIAIIFKKLFTIGCVCAYVGLTLILCLQALKPASESSNISNNVGDKIDQIVTDISKPTVETIAVESVEIISLTLNGQTITTFPTEINVGDKASINAKVLPQNASNPALNYSSSNDAVLKVFPGGRLEPASAGEATITVSSQENAQKTYSVSITVTNKVIALESLSITNIPSELRVNQSHRLEAKLTPTNTTQKSLTWQSSAPEILTVTSSGTIKGIAEGTATITVTSSENSEISASTTIQVLPEIQKPVYPVESIAINANKTTFKIGESVKLTTTITPTEANDSVIWTSSDEEVATISQSGVISFLKAGNVTITARCSNYEAQALITLTVKEALSSTITIETENLTQSGESFTLKAGSSGKIKGVLDENATILEVVYSSSDSSIASVSADGVIQALKAGTVTITATTSYDGQSVSQSIILTVERITVSDTIKNFYYLIRKGIGHFGAFLVLGIFAAFSYFMLFPKSTKGKIISFAICLIAGFAIAGLTEILQLPYFTQGRHCSFSDVMLDFKGYCSSTLSIYFIIFAVHFIKIFKNKRANANAVTPSCEEDQD